MTEPGAVIPIPGVPNLRDLGGWPTTAFLTAGGELLAGGTFVPVERMTGVLEQVAEAFARRAAVPAVDESDANRDFRSARHDDGAEQHLVPRGRPAGGWRPPGRGRTSG